MKRKNLISVVVTLALTASVMVGATLAYLTDKTDTVTNTFTIGNVSIDLKEPDWDPDTSGKDLVPGAEVAKNPMITNVGASEGYMMMEITGMDAMAAKGFSAEYDRSAWVKVNSDGKIDAEKKDNLLADGYYVYIGTAETADPKGSVAATKSTTPLFTSVKLSETATELAETNYQIVGAVKVDAEGNVVLDGENPVVEYTITGVEHAPFASYAEAEKYVLDPANQLAGEASFVFDLTIKGYAIQAKNVTFLTDDTYKWVGVLNGKMTQEQLASAQAGE